MFVSMDESAVAEIEVTLDREPDRPRSASASQAR
jgi:hypothetical protein